MRAVIQKVTSASVSGEFIARPRLLLVDTVPVKY